MTETLAAWRDLLIHHRLFAGFAAAWVAIVASMSPLGGSVFASDPAPRDASAAPAAAPAPQTLGAISTQATPGGDLFADPYAGDFGDGGGFTDDSTFEDAPPEGGEGDGSSPPPPPPCPADEALPAPVVRPGIDAVAGAQQQAEGAAGTEAPADAGSTAESALCTPTSSSSVVIGGLTVTDMLRLLLGLPPVR